MIVAVDRLRLEVALPSSSTIYFSSGTASPVTVVESTLLLPILFIAVAALFATIAYRMGRLLTAHAPLRAYVINLLGSLAGVGAFALVSWLELPPTAWFGIAFAVASAPFVLTARGATGIAATWPCSPRRLVLVHQHVARQPLVAVLPHHRSQDGEDTVVEVNNIFHQSMAPVPHKEYFYQWPYTVFGDTFDEVLILGAGSGTDVAAALQHGAKHVDAVEIDPVILRLGRECHPDRPYNDPRVTVSTTTRGTSCGRRRKVRPGCLRADRLADAAVELLRRPARELHVHRGIVPRGRGRLCRAACWSLYNYFREKWLVDRLANTARDVFGQEPRGPHPQGARYLGVMIAGPGSQS